MAATESTLIPRNTVRKRLGNIGETTFHKLVNDGRLKIVKLGRKTAVTEEELERFIATLSDGQEKPRVASKTRA